MFLNVNLYKTRNLASRVMDLTSSRPFDSFTDYNSKFPYKVCLTPLSLSFTKYLHNKKSISQANNNWTRKIPMPLFMLRVF